MNIFVVYTPLFALVLTLSNIEIFSLFTISSVVLEKKARSIKIRQLSSIYRETYTSIKMVDISM
jgi:hypothetical protein